MMGLDICKVGELAIGFAQLDALFEKCEAHIDKCGDTITTKKDLYVYIYPYDDNANGEIVKGTAKGYLKRLESILRGSDVFTGNPALETHEHQELRECGDVVKVCDHFLAFLYNRQFISYDAGRFKYNIPFYLIPALAGFTRALYKKPLCKKLPAVFVQTVVDNISQIIYNYPQFKELVNKGNTTILEELTFYNSYVIYRYTLLSRYNLCKYLSGIEDYKLNPEFVKFIGQMCGLGAGLASFRDCIFILCAIVLKPLAEAKSAKEIAQYFDYDKTPQNIALFNPTGFDRIRNILLSEIKERYKFATEICGDIIKRDPKESISRQIEATRIKIKKYNQQAVEIDKIAKCIEDEGDYKGNSSLRKKLQTIYTILEKTAFDSKLDVYSKSVVFRDFCSVYVGAIQLSDATVNEIGNLLCNNAQAPQAAITNAKKAATSFVDTSEQVINNLGGMVIRFSHLYEMTNLIPKDYSQIQDAFLFCLRQFISKWEKARDVEYYEFTEALRSIQKTFSDSEYFTDEIFSFFQLYKPPK